MLIDNFRNKINKWRRMYDFLYTKAIGNSDYKNFGKGSEKVQIGADQTLWPKNIYMDDWSRLQNLTNMVAWKGKLVIKKFAAVGSQCLILPGAHTPTVGIPQFLSIEHINDKDGTIVINEDAWVGARCILLPKCEIGRGAVIGAGSVVSKKIPPYAVAVGSPTRIIAARFNIEQILKHEAILYPPEERMSKQEIEELFKTHYNGLSTIGTSEISEDDIIKLHKAKEKFGIKDYLDQ